MAKTQTRRTISVRGTTYLRVARHLGSLADAPSMSGLIEDLLAAYLDEHGAPDVSRDEVIAYARRSAETRRRSIIENAPPQNFDDPTGIFTF